MPRKSVVINIPDQCPECGSKLFYKNGKCKACVKRQKREQTKIRLQENPSSYEIGATQNIKSEEFRKKATRFWEGCSFA